MTSCIGHPVFTVNYLDTFTLCIMYRLCDETDNPINLSAGKHIRTFGVSGLIVCVLCMDLLIVVVVFNKIYSVEHHRL